MSINGWEHYDLEKEIGNSNMAQLLELFKRESEKFSQECVKYVDSNGKLTMDERKKVEEKCTFLNEARMKVALEVAERMTDITRIQHQVIPNR
ncbi:hypothetical protein MHB77_30520 [Paenibacillus sp. FSL K6-3166]|uniref:hypothetical protein n=1 Tax=Paenibacillus sp. FSL K6-3166 TaxID=2921492 RepID=UPI0030FBA443